MQAYKFDADSKEFLYAEEAFLDPMETAKFVPMRKSEKDKEGNDVFPVDDRLERLHEAMEKVYLLPADSTFVAPPPPKPGYAVCWNGEAWEYIEDHRPARDKGGVIVKGSGTRYWLPGDTYESPARYMQELGDLPEGAILEKPEKPAAVVAREELQAAKAARAATVAKNTVTVDGLVFDADEESQNRLSRGIVAALALGLPSDQTTEWTLADNTAAQVTVQQMAQALLLAGQAQTSVWRKPYEAQAASVQEE